MISVKFTLWCLPQANLLQHLIHFSIRKKTSAETATKLDLISFIWDDDHIWRLDEKNWQCLWCNQTFQGINTTKALAHVLGKKGIRIKSFYVAKEKSHTTRYQELQNYKQARKGVLHDYSEKIRASITCLQNKSSAAIESTTHRSSKIITSSNKINSSVISGFSSASNISSKSNSGIFPNGSLVFDIDGNSQKMITSNENRLTIATSDIIILEGLTFNLAQKNRIQEITGVVKECFQDIYSSQQRAYIQRTN